jgi:hypothetical protein
MPAARFCDLFSAEEPCVRLPGTASLLAMDSAAVEALSRTNFAAVDAVIVVAYLLISVCIGLAVKKYVSDMSTYIGAGRKVGTWLGVATMTGTEMGLITVMS